MLANSNGSATGEDTQHDPTPSASAGATSSSASPSTSASSGSVSRFPSGTTGSYTGPGEGAQHGSGLLDCSGRKVYNLTKWEDQHPGGSAKHHQHVRD